MQAPKPRGPLSRALTTQLSVPPGPASRHLATPELRAGRITDDEDAQLTLFCLYALHTAGLDGVSDDWEWDDSTQLLARRLASAFEAELRSDALALLSEGGVTVEPEMQANDVVRGLRTLVETDSAPSVSAFIQRRATLEQFREFLVLKSLYQLKEADPHTFAIPRLTGREKSALLEVQADEYGNGVPEAMHSVTFGRTMQLADLDPTPGAYLDRAPVEALAADNAIMMFGLQRRFRGAVAGHLTVLEMTSALPMAAYARGVRRLGLGDEAAAYFDEHSRVDAAHEQVCLLDLVSPLVQGDPTQGREVLFGAAVALLTDAAIGRRAIAAWEGGRTALRSPL